MIVPMRRYGLNVAEFFLSDFGNGVAVLLILLTIGATLFPSFFGCGGFWGGVLATASLTSGLLLGLGTGGVRQNRAVLDTSIRVLLFTAIGWVVLGIARGVPVALAVGVLLLLLAAACWSLRRAGVRARFIPRFFTLRQFETMVQIADAMLDADDLQLHPIEVAIRTDHLLDEIDSPVKKDIRLVMFLIEWLTPLLVLRPFPFSSLGTHERQQIIRRVIWSRGLFRDVSRTLKLLSTFPYYTHPDVRDTLGYVGFDQRERSQGLDQTPKTYPAPEADQ